MKDYSNKGFGTKAIHAGVEPEPGTGAIMTPIYQTSTYAQTHPGGHTGYEYSRAQNPTRTALENSFAALENAKHGFAFSSGLAAIDAVLKLFKPGDEIIAGGDLYGGTYRIFTTVFEKFGIKFHFTDMDDPSKIKPFINENTKLIWLETPTNPMMNITDVEAVVKIAKEHNLLVAVDNTFASPYLQNPMDMGADIIMHSVTKYLGGHSDVVMGALMCNDDKLAEQLFFIQYATGAVPGPQDCFLVLRGIKTLHLRMQRHCENGEKLAHYLNDHPKVDKVYWPGFNFHPNHEIAKKQMKGYGGMISFSFVGDKYEDAEKFLSNTKVITLAESLGGVESLSNHPASMTHASIPKEVREEVGITDSLIRLSTGVEDIDDLINDVKQALELV